MAAPCCRLHGSTVRRYINSNTVLVVASAPGFPHGIVDDVAGIAAAAKRRGVCCHVDACLGGFLLPFVERLGYEVPAFDFRVPGESCTLHLASVEVAAAARYLTSSMGGEASRCCSLWIVSRPFQKQTSGAFSWM